jgi:hypothetical protein
MYYKVPDSYKVLKIVYCRICGRQILWDSTEGDSFEHYQWERENKVHVECFNEFRNINNK